MALNDIIFNRNKSGLGAPLLDKDHISGLVYYNDTAPTGFATDNIKKVFSLEQAEDLGILDSVAIHAVEHYHVKEFFEKNPKGELWIGYFAEPADPTTPDFAEVKTMQEFTVGEIRQIGVLYLAALSDATTIPLRVTALQAQLTALAGDHMPVNAVFAPDIFGLDLTTLPDLRALTANNVSVTIGQSGNGVGVSLYATTLKSVTDLGAKLGAVSAANVNESIGWVEKFQMVTASSEFNEPAFSNGDFNKGIPKTQLNAIDDLGYIFLINYIGYSGTFNSDSYTAVATSNDLATIENNRTIDKAVRTTRTLLMPKLSSPVFVGADGSLTYDTIAVFKGLCDQGLAQMESNGELSAFQTIIDPSQDVVTSGEVTITLELVPVGVARSIIVNIGFVPQINS
mgnify:FL=1